MLSTESYCYDYITISYHYIFFFYDYIFTKNPRLYHLFSLAIISLSYKLKQGKTMKIDIVKTLDNEITNHFAYTNDLPFFMHQNRFKQFNNHKSVDNELTLEVFLSNQSDNSKNRHSFIKLDQSWQYDAEREVLISSDSNLIDYALVPLIIIEKQTNKEFRVGQNHIVTPDNVVYKIAV